jgi:tight adherence protein C
MNPYLHLLLEREFLVVAFSAIAAFATVVTLGLPYLAADRLAARMKSVASRREQLRQRQFEALAQGTAKGQLRHQSVGFMKQIVDKYDLRKLLESPGMKEKLARAGYRGQAPFFTFLFFRFAMPPMVLFASSAFLFGAANLNWSVSSKLIAAVASALVGYYLPDVFLSNRIAKRMESIMRAFPDALDLLLICVESGMSIEAAIQRVSQEVGTQSAELAEELALTTAELSYLPNRRQAFQNLASRCAHSGVKAVAAALIQSEKYGTPVGQALRVTAQENREMRMSEAERKAASLPAKLTVPMITFFLPCLFVVIMGPAVLKIMGYVK